MKQAAPEWANPQAAPEPGRKTPGTACLPVMARAPHALAVRYFPPYPSIR
jgi:hypothetical protein